jgi:hypothetical protein
MATVTFGTVLLGTFGLHTLFNPRVAGQGIGARRRDCCACPTSVTAGSKHLKVLEPAGLVRRGRRGRDHLLTLYAEPLREVARWALGYERYRSENTTYWRHILPKGAAGDDFNKTKYDRIDPDTRLIPASPAEVYDVWIDPKSPGGPWFGAAKAIVQPVVDGLFYHVVRFEGHDWAHYGRFVTLDRPSRIEHTCFRGDPRP